MQISTLEVINKYIVKYYSAINLIMCAFIVMNYTYIFVNEANQNVRGEIEK